MKKILVSGLTLLLTGCFPMYKPVDMTKTVVVKTSNLKDVMVCQNKEWFQVKHDVDGAFRVSYGQRIGLIYHYNQPVTNGYVHCSPSLSFIPKAGQQYYLNFDIKDRICHIEMLRYTKKNNIGMVPESTASRDSEC